MSDVTFIDNSTFVAMATCDTQAAIRYVLGLTVDEDRAPLRAGHLAHKILEAHLKGRGVQEIVEVQEVADYMAWSADAIPDGDRLSGPNVLKIMSRWLETHPVSGLPFVVDPSLVEVGFATPLTDDIIFVGRMDALVQDENGAWFVLEHKTTGRLDETWRRRYRTSSQITGYVWAAQQHLRQPVAGCFVNGIEFGKLPTDTRKCRTHSVPYPECSALHAKFDMLIEHRAPHQLEAWKRDAIRLAHRFKALKEQVTSLEDLHDVPMIGQLTGACINCQFADFCAVGRPPATGRAILKHEPWSPYEHALG